MKKFILLILTIVLSVILISIIISHKNKLIISGMVVPHHDLVADKRAQFFLEFASHIKQPQTIILVSPNHYFAGQEDIQTTSQDWILGEGKITPNKDIISFLIQEKLAANEPASFTDEHGIYSILKSIHNNFPNATLVPLILKDVSEEKLHKLKEGLRQSCNDCLMIASVDFSHYQPALLAKLHDDKTIRDLQTLDTKDILINAEVDSGPALALLTMWAKDHKTLHFTLNANTNSGIIFKNPDLESTTHVFGWYQKGDIVQPKQSVSFLFGGDMMFSRGIGYAFGSNFNNAVAKLGPRVFWGTDASVINLEGAITQKPITIPLNSESMVFRFGPAIIKTLSFLHINVASQANNHSDDAGVEGLATTRSLLGSNGIQFFGGPTQSSVSYAANINGYGINLTIFGINLTYPGQSPQALVPFILEAQKDPAMRIIIMPHWGTEYLEGHTKDQQEAAHMWIDAGADMVIGSHPHIIEDAEIYKNTPIIYSLGNLLFDQTFSRATQEGLLIGGKFTDDGLTFFGLPIQSINYQPQLIRGERKNKILNSFYMPFKNYMEHTAAGNIVQMHK